MTDKETERIRKQAYDYYSIEIYPVNWNILREGYIAGATAENERMAELLKQERNKAIDEAIEKVSEGAQFGYLETPIELIRKELEALKS